MDSNRYCPFDLVIYYRKNPYCLFDLNVGKEIIKYRYMYYQHINGTDS